LECCDYPRIRAFFEKGLRVVNIPNTPAPRVEPGSRGGCTESKIAAGGLAAARISVPKMPVERILARQQSQRNGLLLSAEQVLGAIHPVKWVDSLREQEA
jgi:hypothetical protein